MTGRKRRKLLLVEYFYVYGTYKYVCMYVFMYVCMYACMYVRMYMYVCAIIIIIIIIIIIVIIFIIIIFLDELVITMHPLLYMKMMNPVSFFVIFYCFIVFIVDNDCTTANNESITTGKI